MIRSAILLTTALLVPQTPVFRSGTNRVAVDVAVYAGRTPVQQLTVADFRLTDNGVPQEIEVVDLAEVPIDVTLVVDVSGSTLEQVAAYQRDIAAVGATLRSIDRLRVISFETAVRQELAFVSPPVPPPVLNSGRTSSVHDGVAAALVHKPDPGRRHLVLAYTDGYENRSILTGGQLVGFAKTSEAVLHLVAPGILPFIVETDRPCMLNYWYEASAAPAPPCKGPPALREAVETTGGRVHVGAELAGPFRRIMRDFLHSYVLYYQPAGVAEPGWHEIAVAVTRPGRYTVHARRGYFSSR